MALTYAVCNHRESPLVTVNADPCDGASDDTDACSHGQLGGESAGSNLAALTLLRLRDAGKGDAFRAASLLFGVFDLSLTPSVFRVKGAPFISLVAMRQFTGAFAGAADLKDPAISPLYADLHALPPALFSVGSVDPLLDDSLFMSMRWQAAGNLAHLAIYPGGTHGFNALDGELAAAGNPGGCSVPARDADRSGGLIAERPIICHWAARF